MQGIGAVNMSMGGAATGQAIDISGALQWNPAAISTFDNTIVKLDVGMFFSSPTLSSTVPEMDMNGMPTGNMFSGTTEDDRPASLMPALAFVYGKEDSKSTFGASVFGISGFGVTFPENMDNAINMPQAMGGFGHIESDYSHLQIGVTYAYEITDEFSIGIAPTFNYATLQLMPNPTADPTMAGYPSTEKASTTGFGGQIGLYYGKETGFSAGVSYKSSQSMSEFEFENTYLDNSTANSTFQMDYPAIISVGVGYSKEVFDIALDYRMVDYENTKGFSETGWTQMGSVIGFGWKNVSIISAGLQYKQIDRLPLRIGYTYSSNPITDELAFFNIPAPAIINHAFQLGLTFEATESFSIDAMYHHGMSSGETTGPMLNSQYASVYPPYGAVPQTSVSYDMTTDLIMIGLSYVFNK